LFRYLKAAKVTKLVVGNNSSYTKKFKLGDYCTDNQ